MANFIKYVLLTYLIVVLFVGLVLPPLPIISVDNFILPFVLVALLLTYSKERMFWISAITVTLIMITGIISNYINGGITVDELLWNVRWLKLFSVFWTFYYAVSHTRLFLEGALISTFLILVVINSLQLLNIEFVIDLYATKSDVTKAYKSTLIDARLGGTFLNPNNNGMAFALFAVYFTLSTVRWKYIFLAIATILVVMTQSRTVFVAFVLSIGLIASYRLLRENKKYFLYLLIGGVLSILLLSQLKFNNLSSLFNGSAFTSNSVMTRFDIVDKVIDQNKEAMWFGQGKVGDIPALIGGSIDNEYAYLYLEYGLIGVISLLLMIGLLFMVSIKSTVNIGVLSLLLIAIVCGMTNLSFSNMETGYLLFGLMGAFMFSSVIKKIT